MVVIVDFGGQYTHLIARRIRQLNVRAEIFSPKTDFSTLSNIEAIILSGGPFSVYDPLSPQISPDILKLKVPILGICYGQQLLAKTFGGLVKKGEQNEFGREKISISKSKLFSGLEKYQDVWFSHGDQVVNLAKGFRVIASSKNCKIVGFENGLIFGIQFHPEVTHTDNGLKILENFLEISRAKKNWKMGKVVDALVDDLKKLLKNEKVLIAVSGGVDSLVASVLLKKAVGHNIYPVFVDTGLLRKNEAEKVNQIYKKLKFRNFCSINARSLFLKNLKGVIDPEQKRKIIGHTFIEVFSTEAKRISIKNKITYLAQGTIYPDRVESAKTSKSSAMIKSHHNLMIPKKFDLKLVEPLADLYKDEVRKIGEKLGISKELLYSHPFPGPGLAVRVLGKVTQDKLKILREVDAVYISTLKEEKVYEKIWQAFAVLLSDKSVGVVGDKRNYGYIVSLRAVTSTDGMTADWFRFDHELLEKLSSKIINKVEGISRVVYDITQKPPATIEYE